MKIGNDLYFCGWCSLKIEAKIDKRKSSKKASSSGQLRCPKCNNLISQKVAK